MREFLLGIRDGRPAEITRTHLCGFCKKEVDPDRYLDHVATCENHPSHALAEKLVHYAKIAEWRRFDIEDQGTYPPAEEIVELAVQNNGHAARAFGAMCFVEDGWCWAQADGSILWGGIPVMPAEILEWGSEEVYAWRPLAELPPIPKRKVALDGGPIEAL